MRLSPNPGVVTNAGTIDPAKLQRLLQDIANQLNASSEGQVVGATNAQITFPSTGTHNQGDFIKNLTPSGATPVLGWICTVAGTPGTFVAVTVGGGAGVTVEEVDGAPTVAATKIVFPNGTLAVVGPVATYTPTGGAGSVTNTGTLTNNAVVVGNGGVDVSTISVGTNGQLLLGATGADPAFATMSGDATITAAGAVTVKAGGIPPKGAFWDGGGFQILANTSLADVAVYFPAARTITQWTILTRGGTGSCVIDIWKDSYANFPPTVADTITAAAKPTVTTGTKGQSSTLTGWTTSIAAGDVLMFKVDSTSVFTHLEIWLEFA